MAQLYLKKRSDEKPQPIEGTDNGEVYVELGGADTGRLADILAKLSADPATQSTLAALLAAEQATQASSSNDGAIYENQNAAIDDTARRFETSVKKLKDVLIQVSGGAQLFGDAANQRYLVDVGGWIGFQKIDISTLYFKNVAEGENGTVNIIGVEE